MRSVEDRTGIPRHENLFFQRMSSQAEADPSCYLGR
jgi:hypothetical protein